ncbi:MAG: agmatine deiminase family protein [Pseudomonadota bacterium]
MLNTSSSDRELIILAAPNLDGYYDAVQSDIVDFHIRYAKAIRQKDDVVILAGPELSPVYREALGSDHVVVLPMADIWMRDFAPLNAARPVMMRYSAAGQGGGRKGQREADFVQGGLAELLNEAGVQIAESDLINDGGNFVDDYHGRVVLSRKFLRDNDLSESEGRAAVKDATGADHVAFIEADEQGGLEHADGVVAFIGPNRLVINSYPEDPDYADALKADLRRGLPGVTLQEILTPYDGSNIYDERFGSACGLYTNMLVTPNRIYVPQFGIPEDAVALEQLAQWTELDLIPVSSEGVCYMGGGVRCMSWQLRGPDAQTLKAWLLSQSND